MLFESLKGTKLKKDLGAVRVSKSYHNKHKLGSGNFGFIVAYKNNHPKPLDEFWFRLDGSYNSDGKLVSLSFGSYGGGASRGLHDFTYTELISYMKRFVKHEMN